MIKLIVCKMYLLCKKLILYITLKQPMSLMIDTQEVMFSSSVFFALFNRHNSHISDALLSKHLSIFFLIIHLSTQYCLDNMGGHKYKPFVQRIISVHRCVHITNYSTHDSQDTKQLMKSICSQRIFSVLIWLQAVIRPCKGRKCFI